MISISSGPWHNSSYRDSSRQQPPKHFVPGTAFVSQTMPPAPQFYPGTPYAQFYEGAPSAQFYDSQPPPKVAQGHLPPLQVSLTMPQQRQQQPSTQFWTSSPAATDQLITPFVTPQPPALDDELDLTSFLEEVFVAPPSQQQSVAPMPGHFFVDEVPSTYPKKPSCCSSSEASASSETSNSTDAHSGNRDPSRNKIYYRRSWSTEEDAKLVALVKEMGVKNWSQLAQFMLGKSANQCSQRWQKALDPHIIKGKWSSQEDKLLLSLVKQHGRRWKHISNFIPGRTGKQCRDRYVSRINPDLVTGKWTDEEVRIVMDAHKRLGNRWASINKLLPNRSWYTIKWKVESLNAKTRPIS